MGRVLRFVIEATTGDIAYIWKGTRWTYLPLVIDLFSCKPVSWALPLSPNTELVKKALTIVYESRGEPQGTEFGTKELLECSKNKWQKILDHYKER